MGSESHQGSGEAEDGQECTGRGEGTVLADTRLLPHLHVGCRDVISQRLRYDGLSPLTQGDVTSGGSIQLVT